MAKKKTKLQTESTEATTTETKPTRKRASTAKSAKPSLEAVAGQPAEEMVSEAVPEVAAEEVDPEVIADRAAEETVPETVAKLAGEKIDSESIAERADEETSLEGDGGLNPRVEPTELAGALAPEESSSPDAPEAPSLPSAPNDDAETESEDDSAPRPPAKLERLQKILAAAGVASRRSAEALIEQGRVQVNGKVVTVLGTKADAGRDHIRVDGKLLQGAERLRYFVLNKPRGFVTTVKDPEGRPTVMQFFEKMKERLYPVGRLDYMTEGLLVVTNDGELANQLTKASSGVEKTYLVKVAGQPTEADLDILRGGVLIERGGPGSPRTGLRPRGDSPGSAKVRTAPARIRQVRQGDNPWFEVILIEGRNRELRKMFEEIGHFVEKIRRTGYGPLILDQEPGKMRELEPRELELLRKAAEGKLTTPKSKEVRRRNAADAGILPTVRPKPSGRPRPLASHPPVSQPSAAADRPTGYRPKTFGPDRTSRPERPERPYGKSSGPSKTFRTERDRPERGGPGQFRTDRPSWQDRPYGKSGSGKPFRPERNRSDRPGAEGFRPAAGRTSAPNPVRSFSHVEDEGHRRSGGQTHFGSARPSGRSFDRPAYDRPGAPSARQGSARPGAAGAGRSGSGRPFSQAKPAWKKPERAERSTQPAFQRPVPPRRESRFDDDDLGPVRKPNLRIEEIKSDRPSGASARPSQPGKPFKSGGAGRSYGPPRGSASGDRPGYGPKRPFESRPAPGSAPRTERKASPGWKPKPAFGGPGKPAAGSRSKPRPGGFKSSSYKGKPTGPKRFGGKKRK